MVCYSVLRNKPVKPGFYNIKMSVNSMRFLVIKWNSGAAGFNKTDKINFNSNAQQNELRWREDSPLQMLSLSNH